MPVSAVLAAKRALVTVLLELAGLHGLLLNVNRDSDDTLVASACRRVARKVHPDKGGTAALYAETGQPCVPAATNVGLFWPRSGLLRKPYPREVLFEMIDRLLGEQAP